jgi:hypothetical protein
VSTSCDGGEFALWAIAASRRSQDDLGPASEAGRARLFARLLREHITELDAEYWLGRWEREAVSRGVELGDAFWDQGLDWIIEQRRTG